MYSGCPGARDGGGATGSWVPGSYNDNKSDLSSNDDFHKYSGRYVYFGYYNSDNMSSTRQWIILDYYHSNR